VYFSFIKCWWEGRLKPTLSWLFYSLYHSIFIYLLLQGWVEPRVLNMLSKSSMTEQHPSLSQCIFKKCIVKIFPYSMFF
jgi:hypothetical protein